MIENLPENASNEMKIVILGSRGNAFSSLDRKRPDLDDYKKILEINPEDSFTCSNVAHIYIFLNEYNEALIYINRAIDLNPDNDGFYVNRGSIFANIGQHEKAIKDYNRAIEINPISVIALNNRGNIYAQLNRYEEAIADFSSALKLQPDSASLYVNLGIALSNSGNFEKAHQNLNKALELDSSNLPALHNKTLKLARQEIENTRQMYEERLLSVTDPSEIDERFQKRKREAEERLSKLREEADKSSAVLVKSIPITWAVLALIFTWEHIFHLTDYELTTTQPWSLTVILTSVSLAAVFLNLPLLTRLTYLNRNARIERHVLEDYERKSVMLLIRNLQGENVNTVLKHYKNNGTPEVLNKLYHPKQAYRKSESKIKRGKKEKLEKLLKSILKISQGG